MIVETDFLDHWKTRALVDLSRRPDSPIWLIRLWGHCQARKAWVFSLPPIALKSICGAPVEVDAEELFKWLKECRFLEGTRTRWTVHDWAKHNSRLIANWNNPKKGQRKANDEPTTSQAKTNDEPITDSLTLGPPDRSDREDRVDREEGLEGVEGSEADPAAPAREGKPSSFGAVEAFIVEAQIPITPTSAAKFFDHFEANGWRTRTGPLRDWRAALRNWARREGEFSPAKNSVARSAAPTGQLVSDPVIFK